MECQPTRRGIKRANESNYVEFSETGTLQVSLSRVSSIESPDSGGIALAASHAENPVQCFRHQDHRPPPFPFAGLGRGGLSEQPAPTGAARELAGQPGPQPGRESGGASAAPVRGQVWRPMGRLPVSRRT